jgi:hypothetical protein
MSEKKEFEAILIALGERDLSEWELERLWELIAEDPARMDEYLQVQNMNMSLSKMELNVVEHKSKTEKNYSTFSQRMLFVASMIFVLVGAAYFLNQAELAPQQPLMVSKEIVEPPKMAVQEKPDSPVDAYQKMLSQIPKKGSMNRPPTTFSNAAGQGEISFNEVIRPILSENCFACHGPDAKNAEADLRLDSLEGAMMNHAIVPGKPEESEVIKRIMTKDTEDIMPPLDSHKELSDKEKQLLRQWIAEGAHWEEHWAFVVPKRSALSDGKLNAIDAFVQKKLKEVGLQANRPLDRYALARRVSFDLIGLPPKWEDVEAFVNDKSETAYQTYLDKLFSDSRYGEHQARFWMDAARYGDTHGMHLDNYREIWPYRDWVIKAFNQNMPFDQFTIEQLAGDLLPKPNEQQLIATGFNRCTSTTSEGGSIPEELDVRYMVDRIETVGAVFMGLTIGCAACHDHKFDPISAKDFYQFGAFFNNTTQPAMDGNQKDSPPVLTLPNDKYKNEWKTLLTKRHSAMQKMESREGSIEKHLAALWDSQKLNSSKDLPVVAEGLEMEALVDGQKAKVSGNAVELSGSGKADPNHPSGIAQGVMIDEKNKNAFQIKNNLSFASKKPFAVSMWLRTPDEVRAATLFQMGKNIPAKEGDKNKKATFVGLTVKLTVQGAIDVSLSFERNKSMRATLAAEMATKPNSWQHICVRYSGGQSKTSLRIAVNGKDLPLRIGSQSLTEGDHAFDGIIRFAQGLSTGGMSHLRLYNRWVHEKELFLLAKEFELQSILKYQGNTKWVDLKQDQKELLQAMYLENIDEAYRASKSILADTQTRRDYIYSRSTTTLIMEEKTKTKPVAHILERGEYDKRGEKVTPNTPHAFPAMDPKWPKNRLGLAYWLVDSKNPLTARVTVNRLWESIFGAGLMKSVSDFGTMGSQPSHPELLDWLALEFMESGWDVQHVLRLMVSSKTYRQNAVVSQKSFELDPENKWLSRGPRVRLDAEEIRDQALAVSGLLKHQVGGPSVKPYQPAGLWRVVAFAGSNTKSFEADKGDKLYRRSLYTFWKKTSPPPSMEAFNAPTRENCTVSREKTNTPLQALVLMNDPQFFEAARYLAQKALTQKTSDQDRIKWILRQVFIRPHTEVDVIDLTEALASFRTQFSKAPDVAKELIEVGESPAPSDIQHAELASWTMIANVVMNRDD